MSLTVPRNLFDILSLYSTPAIMISAIPTLPTHDPEPACLLIPSVPDTPGSSPSPVAPLLLLLVSAGD